MGLKLAKSVSRTLRVEGKPASSIIDNDYGEDPTNPSLSAVHSLSLCLRDISIQEHNAR